MQTGNVAAVQTRTKKLGMTSGRETCSATQLYFLEVVKARAVTALCKNGVDRERDLGRLDADVEHINEAIAAVFVTKKWSIAPQLRPSCMT